MVEEINNQLMKRNAALKVTFFGDSICVGQGISLYRGWVTQIARHLEELVPRLGREILVSNASVNGRTTRQALEDMPYSVQSPGVDILVVQFGLNDCNYWASDNGLPRVGLGSYRENLREIVTRGFNCGANFIFLNNNHPTNRDQTKMPNANLTYEDSNRRYCEEVRSLVAELPKNVIFHDIHAHVLELCARGVSVNSFLLEDGLHLSEAGHSAYFQLMAPAMTRVVEQMTSAVVSVGQG